MRLILFTMAVITITAPSWALDEYWIPVVDGEFWSVAGNPHLGKYTSKRQAPVDFSIWQANDGTWQLWSCIRSTKCGGKTRLFHRWEGKILTDTDWKPMGIAMEARTELGETPGGMQSPHVFKHNGLYWMAYGDRINICFATSKDGKHFDRVIQPNGKTGVFSEGPVENTRDPMLIKIDGLWHCYYTASEKLRLQGYIFCRTSNDLKNWSRSVVVSAGGQPDVRRTNAECPHVIEIEPGRFCLFRNHKYGRNAQFTVYYSENPLNFGINHNHKKVRTMPYAAPEVIYHQGKYYLAVLKPRLDGIRIARLKWIKYRSKGKNIFDFNEADTRQKWKIIEGDLHSTFTTYQPENMCLHMAHYIGTAELDGEKRDDKRTGVIESPPFTLAHERYTLFVSGGDSYEKLYVAIIDEQSGREIKRFTGKMSHILEPILFQSGPSQGQKVRIRIVDRHQGKWGRINFGGIYTQIILAEK
ncbi:MAG: glycoside hydrolase family protein [Planctomycetota bacterium]